MPVKDTIQKKYLCKNSLQEIEQKTKYFAKSTFINLSFLITLFKAHERRWFLQAVFQGRNSQYLSDPRREKIIKIKYF